MSSTTTTTTTTKTTTAATTEGYGATIAANPPTDSITTQTDYCGDSATGYYEEYVSGSVRYVIVSGAPSHAAEYDQDVSNPNIRCIR